MIIEAKDLKCLITTEQYLSHDCHLSPEDSCSTCERWAEQQEFFEIRAYEKREIYPSVDDLRGLSVN